MLTQAQPCAGRFLTQAHLFNSAFRAPNEDMSRLDEAYRRGLVEHNTVRRRKRRLAKWVPCNSEGDCSLRNQVSVDPHFSLDAMTKTTMGGG